MAYPHAGLCVSMGSFHRREVEPMWKTPGVLAIAGLLAVAGTPTAHAESATLRDPAGDVTRTSYQPGGSDTNSSTGDPDGRTARLTHNRTNVEVRVTFRNLVSKDAERLVTINLYTKGPAVARQLELRSGPKGYYFENEDTATPIPCNIDYTILWKKDTLVAKVPRSCLDNPRSVRMFANSARFEQGASIQFRDSFDGSTRYVPRG